MTLALVLGGGGLRGAAHLGVIKVLEEEGIKPDLMVGTSAGSLAAALHAAGFQPQDAVKVLSSWEPDFSDLEMAWTQDLPRRLNPLDLLPLGIIPLGLVGRALNPLLGKLSFEEMSARLALVATDICHGRQVVFHSGPAPSKVSGELKFIAQGRLIDGVLASIAIPGVFTPHRFESLTLVDGGVLNNVPADVARTMGADKVLAVDLGFSAAENCSFGNLLDVLLQTFDLMGQRITNLVTAHNADYVLNPGVGSANLWEFKRLPEFYQKGIEAARRQLPQIGKALDL